MTTVWLIQPKYVPQEFGYWSDVDRCLGFMAEDYLTASPVEKAKVCDRMTQFLKEWRGQEHRPTILILDELSLLKAIFPDWYGSMLVPQILTEMSSGETDRRALWAITQSPLCGDVGLSGGNKAPFDLMAIEAEDTQEHLASICRSYSGVKKPSSSDVFERSESPKKTAGYHSAMGDWFPMCAYPPFERSRTREPDEPAGTLEVLGGSEVQNVHAPSEPVDMATSEPEPQVSNQVLSMKGLGLTQDQIIEAVWDVKKGGSKQYQMARAQYQQIISQGGQE
jgi:hypothetical protein